MPRERTTSGHVNNFVRRPLFARRHSVTAGEIERVEPQKDSMVIVVANELRGQKGTLYADVLRVTYAHVH